MFMVKINSCLRKEKNDFWIKEFFEIRKIKPLNKSAMRKIFTFAFFTTSFLSLNLLDTSAQIIDVHLHSYTNDDYQGGLSSSNLESPKTADLHLEQTIEQMNKHNIKYAVVSGSIESVEKYVKADPRFIPGYIDVAKPIPIGEFESLIKEGKIKVFGEITAVYHGMTLNDPMYAPYLELCEKYDIPVAYHTGGTFPMAPYNGFPKFRLSLGDPFLIEDVLVRYPKLRVYLMHAGENYYQNTVRMLHMYTHLYADLGVLLWIDPFAKYEAVEFLKLAKKANVLDRVLFGTDQMVWPDAISKSIEFLNQQDFLTEKEKRMILYDNAKTFLKLN
jgi:hypothetical protein